MEQVRQCGAGGGATYPEELQLLREIYPEVLFLIPGVGAQGATLKKPLETAWMKKEGDYNKFLAADNLCLARDDFATAARKAAMDLRERINSYR